MSFFDDAFSNPAPQQTQPAPAPARAQPQQQPQRPAQQQQQQPAQRQASGSARAALDLGQAVEADPFGFALTPDETRLFAQLWAYATRETGGVFGGQRAVAFLSASGLPTPLLGEIWRLVDVQGAGAVDETGFCKLLKLVAWAQAGKAPSVVALNSPTPLPVFTFAAPTPAAAEPAADALQMSEQDVARYESVWARCQPVDGLVAGQAARDFFLKSNIPIETLGLIWNLVDTKQAGSLDKNEFFLAMHFITSIRMGRLETLPPAVPAGYWASVARTTGVPVAAPQGSPQQQPDTRSSQTIAESASMSMNSSGIPERKSSIASPPEQPVSEAWSISDAEKTQYRRYFTNLDTAKRGFVTGEDCYGFMLKSKLPEPSLAQIWDLSDTSKTGQLSEKEFITMMHLIKSAMAGKPLPQAIPPHMQQQQQQQQAPPPGSPAQSINSQVSAGGASINEPLPSSSFSALSQTPETSVFKSHDFDAPKSSEPRSASATPTPASATTVKSPEMTVVLEKLKEVKDVEAQISAIKAVSLEQKKKREQLEKDMSLISKEKEELLAKLAQAKADFDAEAAVVRAAELELAEQRRLADDVCNELAANEAAFQALASEKQAAEQAIEDAKREMAEMKAKIKQNNERTAPLKQEIERLKKEYKTQRNFVDVNQQMFQSSEQAFAKLKDERDRIVADPASIADSNSKAASKMSLVADGALSVENVAGILPAADQPPPPMPPLATKPRRSLGNQEATGAATPPTTQQPPQATTQETTQSKPASMAFDDFDSFFGGPPASAPAKIDAKKRELQQDIASLFSTDGDTKSVKSFMSAPAQVEGKAAAGFANPTIQPIIEAGSKSAIDFGSVTDDFSRAFSLDRKPPSQQQQQAKQASVFDGFDMPAPAAQQPQQQQQQPPPQSSSDTKSVKSMATFQSTAKRSVMAAANVDFDNEFDKAFSDAAPATTAGAPPPAKIPAALISKNEFDVNSAFGGFPAANNIKNSAANNKSLTNLDDIFGGAAPAPSHGGGTGNIFSFDDAFGEPEPVQAAAVAPPPVASTTPAAAGPSDPKKLREMTRTPPPEYSLEETTDKSEKIQSLIKMGFPQERALEALERYDYDLQKATNFLLDL